MLFTMSKHLNWYFFNHYHWKKKKTLVNLRPRTINPIPHTTISLADDFENFSHTIYKSIQRLNSKLSRISILFPGLFSKLSAADASFSGKGFTPVWRVNKVEFIVSKDLSAYYVVWTISPFTTYAFCMWDRNYWLHIRTQPENDSFILSHN